MANPVTNPDSQPVDLLLLANGVADGVSIRHSPLAWVGVLIHTDGLEAGPLKGSWIATSPVVAAVGSFPELQPHLRGCRVVRQEYPGSLLTPGLVNAHTHLDLTHIGPQPPSPGGFAAFAALVREKRAVEPEAIRASVRQGVAMSLAGGVVAVGDIAGAVRGAADVVAAEELARSPLWGTAFLEFFAIGAGEERGQGALSRALQAAPTKGIQVGIQPHAPYSVSAGSYDWALEQAEIPESPVCTHVAESREEHELIERGTGPLCTMLEELGIWTPGSGGMEHFGRGKTPVAHVLEATRDSQHELTMVHCNDLSDGDVLALAASHGRRGTWIVYCPRSSAYFDAPKHFGPHRYRELQKAGFVVALGTDSIINLEVGTDAITPWHEARLLVNRDGLEAHVALEMMTGAGAMAIGLSDYAFRLEEGVLPYGLAAVRLPHDGPNGENDPLKQAILESVPRTILLRRKG